MPVSLSGAVFVIPVIKHVLSVKESKKERKTNRKKERMKER